MKIRIKAYSVFRDYLGDEVELETDRAVTVGELLLLIREKYQIPSELKPIVIVNNAIVGEDYVLDKDVLVHIAPPFSGGASRNRYISVKILKREEPVDFNAIVNELTQKNPESGALAMFIGFVKGVVDGAVVHELEYTAIEDVALNHMEKIAREEAEKHELEAVILWHRIGGLRPGEVTIIIAATSKSREAAIRGIESILERVKREVPIFKLEKRSNGEYWVIGNRTRIPRRPKER